ncbi:MAG: AEC family transporter [Gammaproteobacteria bacterium]
MLAQLTNILLPVFALAGVGYGWRRLGVPFEREFVTRLVLNVAGPCLIIDTLSNLSVPPGEFVGMLGASAALFAATVLAAWALLAVLRLPQRVYLPVLAIGNTGNLGLPLCVFVFGAEGLGFAVAVYATNSVAQFVFTPVVQSGEAPVRTLLTTPVVYGALIGLGVMFADVDFPVWIDSTIGLLGSLLIPLMLIALGNTLAELRMRRVGSSLLWGTLRIALGFAVAHVIVRAFGLEGIAKGVIILQGSMPAAVFTYLFAARYNRSPEDVAGIVLSSSLIAALILPLLVAYVLGF